jgi:predicted membrane protein
MSKQDLEFNNKRNSLGRGFVLLLLGAFFLLRNMHLDIPAWALSWQMIVIVIGLIISVLSNFKNNAGPIMIFIGGLFMMKDIFEWSYDVSSFIWPAAMIVAGLYLIFRKQAYKPSACTKHKKEKYHGYVYGTVSDDFLDVSSIFSGVNRIVVSKEFKGGSINAVFGGVDINLTQADFNGTIEIEANCVFGGAEIVVPANWEVKVMMNTIFGGVEDKRPVELMTTNPDKTLIIKGSCVFGGIEIKSYK